MTRCSCTAPWHHARLVAITGGPGAGKTALLEMTAHHFCAHVVVLPEVASMLYAGGFPRRSEGPARRAAQRAIFRVQSELETIALEDRRACIVLCDRGTVDGVAYWPDSPDTFWPAMATTREAQLARYAAVIHLRVPDPSHYNHVNPLRVESARAALEIDQRILDGWSGHARRTVIESSPDFVAKIRAALDAITDELPACCRPTIHEEAACAIR
jgi:predicted ATPase